MSDTSTGSPRQPKRPTVLIDRSLDPLFCKSLVDFGIKAKHLDDVFPGRNDKPVLDVEWIELVGRLGWIAVCVNPDMRLVPHELRAIREHNAHVFSLGSAHWRKEAKAFVLGRWWLSILRRGRRADGCFWRLYPDQTIKTIR